MVVDRSWDGFETDYRAGEMRILAHWIRARVSGNVVGLLGSGRSNVLGFLSFRPGALDKYLPPETKSPAIVPVDLNDLPAGDLSTLYRIILRAFDRVSDRLDPAIKKAVTQLYQENKREQDPFVTQSSLHELLNLCQVQQVQVILILNRFDTFCGRRATPDMINTLRALRDNFKDTLSYIVGMAQEVAYLPNPEVFADMYDILDSHVCWVGAMSEADARWVVSQNTQTASNPPSEAERSAMLTLAGNFPALLKAIAEWWLTQPSRLPVAEWGPTLLKQQNIQYRLNRMWEGLTEEEKLVLAKVQEAHVQVKAKKGKGGKGQQRVFKGLTEQYQPVLNALVEKGVCLQTERGYQVLGELLEAFVATVQGRGRGRIWLNEYGQIHQGSELLDLANLEHKLLTFFIKNPYVRHTKTVLIEECWSEEHREGIWEEENLFRLIRDIRLKIEPNTSKPAYIINWRAKPEGGYQFFPEGRPQSGAGEASR